MSFSHSTCAPIITRLNSLVKIALLAVVLTGITCFSASSTYAESVTFAGTSNGSFSDLTTNAFLTFAGSPFSTTFANIAVGQSQTFSVGTFNFIAGSGNANVDISDVFNLALTFTSPLNVASASPAFVGEAFIFNNGAEVTYTNCLGDCNPTRSFSFTTANGSSGIFSLSLSNIAVFASTANQLATLRITAFTPGAPTNAVPEPATMMLLGTGLAGLAAKVRRRRHRQPQQN